MLWDVTIDSNSIGNDMICLPKDMYDWHSSMYCVNQPSKDQNQTRKRIDNLNTKRTRRSHVMYNNELRPSRAKARQLEPWLNVRPNKSIVCKTQQYRCMSIGQPREGNRKLGVCSMLTWSSCLWSDITKRDIGIWQNITEIEDRSFSCESPSFASALKVISLSIIQAQARCLPHR